MKSDSENLEKQYYKALIRTLRVKKEMKDNEKDANKETDSNKHE